MKEGYHRIELNRTVWEVQEKYKNLAGIGSGAYGQGEFGDIDMNMIHDRRQEVGWVTDSVTGFYS